MELQGTQNNGDFKKNEKKHTLWPRLPMNPANVRSSQNPCVSHFAWLCTAHLWHLSQGPTLSQATQLHGPTCEVDRAFFTEIDPSRLFFTALYVFLIIHYVIGAKGILTRETKEEPPPFDGRNHGKNTQGFPIFSHTSTNPMKRLQF